VPLGVAVTGSTTPAVAGNCQGRPTIVGSGVCATPNGYQAVVASQITLTGDTGQSHPGSVPTGVVPYIPCYYEKGDRGAGFDDVWVPNGQPPPGLPDIPPAVLAQLAYAAMGLRTPDLGFSPAGKGVVRLETWLWGQNEAFKTLSVTATYNRTGAWATVTAVPHLRVSATPGGPSADCADPVPTTQVAASAASCGLLFTVPRADYTVHGVDRYAANWRGSDGNGGQLPAKQTQRDYAYEVDQIQSVNGD
jgi:enoyl reductase